MTRLSPSPRVGWMLVAAVVAVGAMARIAVHASSLGTLDGDEAVWGLMARHAFDGGLSVFLWGQGYGGTAEALLTAPLLAAFGYSVAAVRLVPILLVAVTAVLVWRIGRRTLGEPAASVAGLLVWVWPPFLVWKSVRAHGFYASGLVVVALVLLLALRLAERRRRADVALLGLAVGVGWWLSPQTMAVSLPALAWLTWRRPGIWRDAWIGVPAFVVGSAPWLVSNLQHGWWSLSPDWGDTTYLERLRVFCSATFPMELGVRIPFSSAWLGGRIVGIALYLALLTVLVWVVWRRRRTTLSLAALCLVAYPFLHALSPYAWLTDEPRYVLLLTPVLALLLAEPVRSSAGVVLALSGAALLSAVVLVLVARSPEYEARADGLWVPRDVVALVGELERRGIEELYADYWVAYRIDFESAERVTAAEARLRTVRARRGTMLPDEPTERTDVRHRPYDDAVRHLRTPPYVAVRGTADDRHLSTVLGPAGYRRITTGGFALFLPSGAALGGTQYGGVTGSLEHTPSGTAG